MVWEWTNCESQHEKFHNQTRKGCATKLSTFHWHLSRSSACLIHFREIFFEFSCIKCFPFLQTRLRDILSFYFFGCFQRYTYLCINSRRSPDINECTLWILCALSRSGFCVFRLLARNLSTSLTSSEILTIFFLALLSSSSFDSFRNFCLDWAWVNWDL